MQKIRLARSVVETLVDLVEIRLAGMNAEYDRRTLRELTRCREELVRVLRSAHTAARAQPAL